MGPRYSSTCLRAEERRAFRAWVARVMQSMGWVLDSL